MIGSQLHVEALNETERGIVIEIKCNVQVLLTKMCYSIPFPYDDFTKGKMSSIQLRVRLTAIRCPRHS